MRGLRLLVAGVTVAATVGLVVPHPGVASSSAPRWVQHVEHYPGSISDGVRFSLDPAVEQAQGRYAARVAAASTVGTRNVQMNDDSYPQLPQNEESIATSTDNPMVAVAGANDYVSGGTVVMRTIDGGRHWTSTRVVPVFFPTRDACSGGDPSVAYSSRDHAFYLSQLCFFRTMAPSEVQIFKSLDNGVTWTPGRQSAVAATNYDSGTGTVDDSIFNDKEYITVDNNPTSPHYGRLYVTYTRFHIASDGSSDSCPIQLSYTDTVPSQNPQLTVWNHTSVVPDDLGGTGVGQSANQFSVPVVQKGGTLDIAYVLEECNTSLDHGLRFQQSTDGGATFLDQPVKVNKAGQWKDNPNLADLIPNTAFRAPNTESLAYSPKTGTLAYVYTNYIDGRAKGNIDVSLSHDGGKTWSDAQTISLAANGAPARNNQFFPWIAAQPNGRFVAMWLDRRQDPNNHDIGTFEGRSTDDGASWRNLDISSTTWNPDLGFFTSGAFIGDYSGIAANNQVIYPSWTDGRNTNIVNTGIGETDVFTDVEINT
ncbi:MAG: glycoside hydrolase [Actinomycetota bacterium]|nr:glycoside hydrolase [Actinomycetota bacterium]